jgi:hypothetical protein
VEEESGKVAKIEYVANLSRHTKAVNVIRFSPSGKLTDNFWELLTLHIKVCITLVRIFR